MNGHVQSKTTNPDMPTSSSLITGFKNFSAGFEAVPDADHQATLTVPMDILMGYRANWNKMIPLPSQMGFAGQINVHWNYMCNGVGAGLYAGVGHNASRSSSTIPASFDSTIQSYLYSSVVTVPDEGNLPLATVTGEKVFTMGNNEARSPLQDRVQKTKNIPMGKSTISSGLMFQAGTRLGAMIGNVFPHVRLGWACYQFKAHMTNQHTPWNNNVPVQAKSSNTITCGGALISAGNDDIAKNASITVGIGQYMDAFDGAYNTNNPIKIASKSQWTNAVTIGAGVDWAFNKMTLGFLYQVGICKKLTFKKWNKDVTSGLTGVSADYLGPTDGQLPGAAGNYLATGGNVTMQYGKRTPEVSIAPVMHTAMVSVKYVLGKVA